MRCSALGLLPHGTKFSYYSCCFSLIQGCCNIGNQASEAEFLPILPIFEKDVCRQNLEKRYQKFPKFCPCGRNSAAESAEIFHFFCTNKADLFCPYFAAFYYQTNISHTWLCRGTCNFKFLTRKKSSMNNLHKRNKGKRLM